MLGIWEARKRRPVVKTVLLSVGTVRCAEPGTAVTAFDPREWWKIDEASSCKLCSYTLGGTGSSAVLHDSQFKMFSVTRFRSEPTAFCYVMSICCLPVSMGVPTAKRCQ